MIIFTNKVDEDLYNKIKFLALKRKKKLFEILEEAFIDILKKYENE